MRLAATFAAVLSFTALPALAAVEKPSPNHAGQWWTNSKGCQYSRAGVPGETMWFLIINTAQKGCPTYIKGKSHTGMYKDSGPKL